MIMHVNFFVQLEWRNLEFLLTDLRHLDHVSRSWAIVRLGALSMRQSWIGLSVT